MQINNELTVQNASQKKQIQQLQTANHQIQMAMQSTMAALILEQKSDEITPSSVVSIDSPNPT